MNRIRGAWSKHSRGIFRIGGWKKWWRGQYGEGHDPGLTYPRDGVEVAVRATDDNEAIDEEARLIRRLRLRDNLLGQIPEEAPF